MMIQEEKIIEGNELIAIFDGWYRDFNFNKGSEINWFHKEKSTKITKHIYLPSTPSSFKYHSSWDWLIPVKRKAIETGHCTIVINNFDVGLTTFSRPHEGDGFCKLYFHTSPNANNWTEIQALWNALVDFIEWHNQTI